MVEDIDSSERGQLALKLRDPLQRLNVPVTEAKLGGATANKDRLLPLAFGHVFNLTPLLVNPSLHEYRVHQGAVSKIVEVRDQGLPVSFTTAGLGPGLFRLNQRPFGEVTADVVATVEAAGTAPALIRLLATQYGQVTERFAAAEIDGANFAAMSALCPQPVGLYLSVRENVLAVCQQLAASVGCMLQVSRAGQLRLVRLAAGGAPVAELTPSGYVLGSDKITSRPAVEAGVQLGYARNWSEQNSGLAGGVPEAHKTLYGAQWQQATKSDAAVAARWRLHTEPVQVDTLLVRRVDADAEAQRRLNIFSAAYSAVHAAINSPRTQEIFSAAYSAVHSHSPWRPAILFFSAAYSAVHRALACQLHPAIFSAAYSAVHQCRACICRDSHFSAAYSAVHKPKQAHVALILFSAAYSAVHAYNFRCWLETIFSAAYSAVHTVQLGMASCAHFSAAYSAVHVKCISHALCRHFSAAYSAVHPDHQRFMRFGQFLSCLFGSSQRRGIKK